MILSKNGKAKYAIVDIEEYDQKKSTIKLMGELYKGERSAKEKGWIDSSRVEKMINISD